MMDRPATNLELDELEAKIDGWLQVELSDNPVVVAVDRDKPGERRWFVRLAGEAKDAFTVRFHLRQRTLHYETFFCPAPEDNQAQFYAHLLERNLKIYGGAFVVGEEDAVFLQGHLANVMIEPTELDRVLGSMFAWTEQFFSPAIRIGFESRFS